jgi:tetratricopeptide (TPR) repeat protein
MSFLASLVQRLRGTAAATATATTPAPPAAAEAAAIDAGIAAEAARKAGNAALQAGQAAQALEHYERFVALRPDHGPAHLNRGFALLRLGRLPEAEQSLREAVRLEPADAEAAFFLGQALQQMGRLSDAREAYRQSVAIKPSFVQAWLTLAQVLELLGKVDDALEAHRVATRLDSSCVPGWQGLARCALHRQDAALALQSLDAWQRVQPESADAWGMRADSLRLLGRLDEALQAAERAVRTRPGDGRLLQTRGEAFQALMQYAESERDLQAAVELLPGSADALSALGTTLCGLGRFGEAQQVLERSLQLDPALLDAHHNRAFALMSELRHDEAADRLAEALAAGHADARLQLDLAVACLTVGRWEEGWRQYEWRLRKGAIPTRPGKPAPPEPAKLPWPRWQPGHGDAGLAVFVHPEQGLGDTLQFLRYAPVAAARGVSVLLQVPDRIRPLLPDAWPGITFVSAAPDLAAAQAECPLMSLPHVLGVGAPLPMQGPYLAARSDRLDHWARRLADRSRPRVGLVWAGNPDHPDDARRSMPLEPLRQALQPLRQLQFISLQMDVRERDRPALAAWPELLWIGNEQQDMADTAALIEQLDAVVCVDTSVAHLTGGLGRRLYLLLQHGPDWRWGLGTTDTVWYPSCRLLRQPAADDWDTVLQNLREQLLSLAQESRSQTGTHDV